MHMKWPYCACVNYILLQDIVARMKKTVYMQAHKKLFKTAWSAIVACPAPYAYAYVSMLLTELMLWKIFWFSLDENCIYIVYPIEYIQGYSKLFTTGQTKLNSEHYVIKCVCGQYV